MFIVGVNLQLKDFELFEHDVVGGWLDNATLSVMPQLLAFVIVSIAARGGSTFANYSHFYRNYWTNLLNLRLFPLNA